MNTKEHAIFEYKALGWLKEDGSYCDEIQLLYE